jgi:DNA primase
MLNFTHFPQNINPNDDARGQFREKIRCAKNLLDLETLIRQSGDWDGLVEDGLCPFHDDHSPSFSIFGTYSGPLWKCHTGCGAGDQITYLEVKFQVPRSEAIHMFLQMAGLLNYGGGRFCR